MPKVVDGESIVRKAFIKQCIEQGMAERVYRAFDEPEALGPLRRMVKDMMLSMRSEPPQPLKRALVKERRLRVLAKYPPPAVVSRRYAPGTTGYIDAHFQSLVRHCEQFSAADCYDVIRLAGEWVEQGGLGAWGGVTERGVTAAAEIKQAMRGAAPRAGTPKVADSGRRWQKNAIQPVADAWGDAKRDSTGVLRGIYGEDFRDRPAVRDRADGRFALPVPIRKHDPLATAGRELKRVARDSTVLKLDQIFGLSEMCDISGTSADVLFALETWGGAHLSPVYYTFPLGAVVAGGHHSVLEVALALTLARDTGIDYKVGFYSTLLPRDGRRVGGGCYRAVANAFYHAEQMLYLLELHFLRFWRRQRPFGLVFEWRETGELKRSDRFAVSRVLDLVRRMGPQPSLDRVCGAFGLTAADIADPDGLLV